MHVVPLRKVSSLGVEYLNPVILAIRHIDVPFGIGANTMGQVEFTGIRAWLSPGKEMLAVGCILMNSGVTVPVGNI
jgi:hypothetical protein